MGKETEIKLRAESPAQLEAAASVPEIAAAAGEKQTIRMRTEYFDTRDRALKARRWTLRRRSENGTVLFCLKTAGSGTGAYSERGEWETAAADYPACIDALVRAGAPAELKTLVSGGILQTCGAEFTRLAIPLTLRDGSVCELACDTGILTNGDLSEPLCEAELELKSGAPGEMLRLGELLCAECGLTPEPRSKFARAAALADGQR